MAREKLEQKHTAPRQRVDALVVVTPDFPEKLPKKIASIIKRVAPFEDTVLDIEHESDLLDLNDLMEIDGVLNEALVSDIESGGKMLRTYFRAKESEMLMPRYEEFSGGRRNVTDEAIMAKWNRFRGRVDANMSKILKRIHDDRRPIALNFVSEIMQYSLLMSLVEQTKNHGLDVTILAHRGRTDLPDSQKVLIQCVIAAKLLSTVGEASIYEYSPRGIFDLLRDGAYAPTPEDGIPFDIPGVKWNGLAARAKLKIFSPQNCLILACINIYSSGNELISQFGLSRVSGELVPAGVSLVSAKGVFSALNNPATYERIRDASLIGLYRFL